MILFPVIFIQILFIQICNTKFLRFIGDQIESLPVKTSPNLNFKILLNVQKFGATKFPVQPFTFRFEYCDVKSVGIKAEVPTVRNEKNGEALSVQFVRVWEGDGIEIKRIVKTKKKNKNKRIKKIKNQS